MRAGCLRRNTRSIGQFGRCKSAAIEKRREHGRSCRLSDQPSNLGYQWPSNHRLNLAPGTAGPQVTTSTVIEVAFTGRAPNRFRNRIHSDLPAPFRRSRNPVDASITVEVFIDASDRFGGKIAAMLCWPSHRRDCDAGRRACAGYDALDAARAYPPGPAPRDAAKHARTPAAGRCLSAGAKSLWKSEQWVCRLDRSACGAWRMALDWAWDAA